MCSNNIGLRKQALDLAGMQLASQACEDQRLEVALAVVKSGKGVSQTGRLRQMLVSRCSNIEVLAT